MARAEQTGAIPVRVPRWSLGLAGALASVLSEMRVKRPERAPTDRWATLHVAPRGSTMLGISFRPLQAAALGLDPRSALDALISYPFPMIRLGAYWDRVESEPGRFDFDELDWQVEAAESAGKQIILCVGAVKTFGYPELFVPAHHRSEPLQEGSLIEPASHPLLLEAAAAFMTRVVERYLHHPAIVAWQVEHEPVDPLGMEHSWRLSTPFVRHEAEAVRAADPTRPIMMNGFLATSLPVRVQQWWRTRDQGDSLAVAEELADIVGIDFYPRHGVISFAGRTLYLDGSRHPWQAGRRRRLFAQTAPGCKVMVSEGQAEPWEAVTVPPSPGNRVMYSCGPERLIENYNQCMRWGRSSSTPWAYLLWGAEYWLRRDADGDPAYMDAFRRILAEA